MCRNIKMLFNFDPPVSPEEIRAASLQFVRKISGFNKPSKANEEAFFSAIDAIASISARFLRIGRKRRRASKLEAQRGLLTKETWHKNRETRLR
jgi:hypothetical protein